MKRHPLVAESRIPAEIPQPKNVIDCKWIDTHPIDLPGIAEIYILSYLDAAENKKPAVIAGAEQDAGILRVSLVHENTCP